jgi:hypothetical protein
VKLPTMQLFKNTVFSDLLLLPVSQGQILLLIVRGKQQVKSQQFHILMLTLMFSNGASWNPGIKRPVKKIP